MALNSDKLLTEMYERGRLRDLFGLFLRYLFHVSFYRSVLLRRARHQPYHSTAARLTAVTTARLDL